MEINEQQLPNNVESLQAIIRQLNKSLAEKETKIQSDSVVYQKQIIEQQNKLQYQETEIALLRHRLNKMLIHRYGKRSEQLTSAQLGLFDEADLPIEVKVEEIQQADADITIAAHTRSKQGRRPLPTDLPREQVIHDLSDEQRVCGCGNTLHKIGEDKSEQLEFIPAQVKVIENIYCKYACRRCEENGIKKVPTVLQPIPKSIATAGLLSHVIVSKYADHIPLYRQESILNRMRIDLPRATLCHWVLSCAELCKPLVAELKIMINQGTDTQADETPVQVLNEKDRANTTKSYMWVYHGGTTEQKVLVYDYATTRSGDVPREFLKDFRGRLQTDGYEGYSALCEQNKLTHAGCWAHARRKFADIVKTAKQKGKAHQAIMKIRKLYEVEEIARVQQLTPDKRCALRRERATPILNEFKTWLDDSLQQVPAQSPIGQAISYTLNQWKKLTVYLDHGEVEIDNNRVENAIRPFALGRKNWLFMGSARGAQAGAIIYSLMATCRLYSIEPYAYLKYILDHLPRCKTPEERKKLLPPFVDRNEVFKAYTQATWV